MDENPYKAPQHKVADQRRDGQVFPWGPLAVLLLVLAMIGAFFWPGFLIWR